MVVDFTSRPAKRGGSYGILKIQDYTGAAEFMLFGQDYIDYHNYGVAGTPVLIRGQFVKRFQSSDIKFKINSVRLLAELKGKVVEGISIHVDSDTLTDALHGVLAEHATSSTQELGSLNFVVRDTKSGRNVRLTSGLRIPVNKDLVEKLQNLDINFTINRQHI